MPEAIPISVLITVKTYPAPSVRHDETVCVAGVRMDTAVPEWVRLYPIRFRAKDFDSKFKKYQYVDLEAKHRKGHDPRPESYSPVNDTYSLGEVLDSRNSWAKRRHALGPLIGERTTCELIHLNREGKMNEAIPSLGLIKPASIRGLDVERTPEWSEAKKAKARKAAAPDLFTQGAVEHELEPPPWTLRVHYKCMETGCRGHKQQILDWEVGAACYNWSRNGYPDAAIPNMLKSNWESMWADGKDTHFYIGNQHQYRQSFSILGVWYPKI